MQNLKSLVVRQDQRNYKLYLSLMPLIAGAVAIIALNVSINAFFGISWLGAFLEFGVKSFLWLAVILFAAGFIFGLLFWGADDPYAVLDDKGVWVRHFGFVAWDGIKEMGNATIFTTPLAVIAIRVKDVSALRHQADWMGKIGLLWSRLFGHQHITIANTDVSYEVIMAYARPYLYQ